MNIRHATMNDLEAIAHTEELSYPKLEGASKESIRSRLFVYPNHFWLLEDKGHLIGFINGMVTDNPSLTDEMYHDPSLHNESGRWQMIFSVVTACEHRGKGYAGIIMQQVIADAKKQKRHGIVLTCKERLVPFYTQFGFENEGVSKSTHGNVVWYQMRLRF